MASIRRWVDWLRSLRRVAVCLALSSLFVAGFSPAHAQPPFGGTVFIDPDIVRSDDPTAFASLQSAGLGTRTLFDRRANDWVTLNVFLFTAQYADGRTVEVQVNPEFGSEQAAQDVGRQFAMVVGRLPAVLRQDVDMLWIHAGVQPFGGGNRSLLIHTGQAALYAADGFLEEALIHEAAHTSLDARIYGTFGWSFAITLDPEYISDYARANPDREDVAESFLPYLAVRFRAGRLSAETAALIEGAIPSRLSYFDSLNPDLFPMEFPIHIPIVRFESSRHSKSLELEWSSRSGVRYAVQRSTDLKHWKTDQEVTAAKSLTTSILSMTQSAEAFYRVQER